MTATTITASKANRVKPGFVTIFIRFAPIYASTEPTLASKIRADKDFERINPASPQKYRANVCHLNPG